MEPHHQLSSRLSSERIIASFWAVPPTKPSSLKAEPSEPLSASKVDLLDMSTNALSDPV